MLKRLQTQQQGGELPGGGTPGPSGTPMAAPQKKEGGREIARVRVHIAINMLEQALGPFGAETKEGKVLLTTLSSLARTFGDRDASDLIPAELKQLISSMPQTGGGGEAQQAIQKMMAARGGAGGGGQPPGGARPMPQPQPAM